MNSVKADHLASDRTTGPMAKGGGEWGGEWGGERGLCRGSTDSKSRLENYFMLPAERCCNKGTASS